MLAALFVLVLGAPDPVPTELMRRVRAADGPITIERGETVMVEVTSRLREAPRGDLDGRVSPTVRARGLSVVPWTEEIEVRPGRQSSTVVTYLLLRADVGAPLGPARLGARADVFDLDRSRPVAIVPLDVVANVVAPSPTLEQVDRALETYRLQQARAEQGARVTPHRDAPLNLDRVEMPAYGPTLTGSERLALRAFLVSRLRADAAKQSLRAAGTVTSSAAQPIAERAVQALASMAERAPASSAPRPPPLRDPVRAVEQGIALFAQLDLDLAYRALTRARLTPTLPPERLPDVLIRLGAIEWARGDEATGTAAIGQALCLRPGLAAPTDRPPMAAAIEAIRARARCPRPLALHSVTAAALTTDDGSGVRVRVLFGPDPFHAIERGTVELLDPSGAVRGARELPAERGDLAALEVVFTELELGTLDEPAVRTQARAYDAVGIELARLEATQVPLVIEQVPSSDGVAWWVWAIGGAVAVAAGATTAAIVASSGGTPARTIGPIDVTF